VSFEEGLKRYKYPAILDPRFRAGSPLFRCSFRMRLCFISFSACVRSFKLIMFLGSICGVRVIFLILRLIHSRCFVD
jgi:hypothetical protein